MEIADGGSGTPPGAVATRRPPGCWREGESAAPSTVRSGGASGRGAPRRRASASARERLGSASPIRAKNISKMMRGEGGRATSARAPRAEPSERTRDRPGERRRTRRRRRRAPRAARREVSGRGERARGRGRDRGAAEEAPSRAPSSRPASSNIDDARGIWHCFADGRRKTAQTGATPLP